MGRRASTGGSAPREKVSPAIFRPGGGTVSAADIQRMVDIIVAQFHPEKIILFGSYARGDAGPDSDVDLLVIRQTDEDFYERPVPIRRALLSFPCALDVLVRTPREFDAEQKVYWTAVHDAATTGEVLYERAS